MRQFIVNIKDWGEVEIDAAWEEQAVAWAVEEYFNQDPHDPYDFAAEAECNGKKYRVRASVTINFHAEESE